MYTLYTVYACIHYIHDNNKKDRCKKQWHQKETTKNADFIHLDSTSTSYHSLSVDPKLFKTEKDFLLES